MFCCFGVCLGFFFGGGGGQSLEPTNKAFAILAFCFWSFCFLLVPFCGFAFYFCCFFACCFLLCFLFILVLLFGVLFVAFCLLHSFFDLLAFCSLLFAFCCMQFALYAVCFLPLCLLVPFCVFPCFSYVGISFGFLQINIPYMKSLVPKQLPSILHVSHFLFSKINEQTWCYNRLVFTLSHITGEQARFYMAPPAILIHHI